MAKLDRRTFLFASIVAPVAGAVALPSGAAMPAEVVPIIRIGRVVGWFSVEKLRRVPDAARTIEIPVASETEAGEPGQYGLSRIVLSRTKYAHGLDLVNAPLSKASGEYFSFDLTGWY